MRSSHHRRSVGAAILLLTAVGSGLGACSHVDRAVATSPIPDDYRVRHPVKLVDAPQTLDIFLVGVSGKLDERQAHDMAVYAADYRAHGKGRIRVQVPAGGVNRSDVDATVDAVRRALSASGLKGDIEVASYRVSDPALVAPVRLSFFKLQAQIASHCGDWPEDLASASNVDGWENRTYYDFGCSSQRTLAAQLDDPRDLVRPRAEDPSDVQMRTRAIGDIRGSTDARQGTDPSTAWGASRPITTN